MKYPSTGDQYRSHDWLAHFGIKGQQWGVRRFQNEDGTLTEEGKRRYYDSMTDSQKKIYANMSEKQKRRLEDKLNSGMSFSASIKKMSEESKMRTKRFLLGVGITTLAAVGAYIGFAKADQLQTLAKASLHNVIRNTHKTSFANNDLRLAKYKEQLRNLFDVRDNMTRRQAVSNFLKNKGKIDFSYLKNQNVILDSSDWIRKEISKLADAGAGAAVIRR